MDYTVTEERMYKVVKYYVEQYMILEKMGDDTSVNLETYNTKLQVFSHTRKMFKMLFGEIPTVTIDEETNEEANIAIAEYLGITYVWSTWDF